MALISRKQISGDLSNAKALSGSLVISGSEVITGSLDVTGSILLNGEAVGSGGGGSSTGSLITTASNSGSTEVITFTKGDGSTFDLTIVSASYAVSASHEIVNEVSSSHSVNADTASTAISSSHAINTDTASYVASTDSASYATIAQYTSEWTLGANGSSDYTFSGPGFTGSANDPTIYLVRGQQYKFTNTMGAHPFRIQTTVNGSTGTQYSNGITNNDVSNGTLLFNVPMDAPETLYYQCTSHGSMGGPIRILDETPISSSHAINADTASTAVSSSYSVTASYAENSSGGAFPYSGSAQVTGSLGITGSLNVTSSLTSSTAIVANNITNGYPTSNQWGTNLDGSYFNNFDNTTHVSEILRFIAGLLSSSAANPTANTKTYGSISENKTLGSTSTLSGYVPQDQDIADVTYLIDQGFASQGGTIFPGKTVYTSTTPTISYTSVAGGSTTVSSSVDSQLFGLGSLTSGGATDFRVSGSHSWTFSNTASNATTSTSSSAAILTQDSFGTSNGVTLAKINTVNPAVIPAAFQDGKFASVFSKNLVNWTGVSLTSVSASGTYSISTTIGISTGSQVDYDTNTASETFFWAPVSTINTNLGSQTLATGSTSVTALTLTSGSLSGAPHITGGTYKLDSTASGLFEPLYAASTTLGDVTITSPTPSNVTVTNTAGVDTLSTSGGTIQTANAVYSAAGAVRSTGIVPYRTDLFHISASYTLSGTGQTFRENGFVDTDFTLAIKGRDRSSSQSTLKTNTVDIHTAGTFGQPAASGSMGYFGGGTASTALIERFTNETYRRVILSPTGLTTSWTSTDKLTLGDGEGLQVKPGYLVNPESSFGYFYPTGGFSASHYKWYLREFTTGAGSNQSTLTIDLSPDSSADLVDFNTTTSNKIAIGVIFENQLPANSGDARTIIFDAVKGNSSYGGALDNQGASNQLNPFNANVDVQADFSSLSNSSGTLTLGLSNAVGQTINGTNDKIWLLIRYTGKPVKTIEQITVSVS